MTELSIHPGETTPVEELRHIVERIQTECADLENDLGDSPLVVSVMKLRFAARECEKEIGQ